MKARNFPPGVGSIPMIVAVAAAAVVSAAAVIPQFETKVIGTTSGAVAGGPAVGPNAAVSGGATPISGPGGPQIVQGPGGRQLTGPVGGSVGSAGKCGPGHNGGNTAPGVTATQVHVTTTDVTTGIGAGFLGEAVFGMKAALQHFNATNGAQGVCGRQIVLDEPVNDGWDRTTGQQYIEGFINSNNEFALLAEPDSEGLSGAIDSGDIDRAGIPVVGTDGMLRDQYHSQWVWPVAASTVTNMHIIAQYAVQSIKPTPSKFGIVFDQTYRFGPEGATAFANEIKRLTGKDISGGNCSSGYCAIQSSSENGGGGGYDSQIQAFNGYCKPCDVVVMLLEPKPMEDWMAGEGDYSGWYSSLMGGEPLFDYKFGSSCARACRNMIMWTGYKPVIPPFDGLKPVYTYAQALGAVCSSCDAHNEFTEGAYLGTELFIAGLQKVADSGLPLTRPNLRDALDTLKFDSGLTAEPLSYSKLPHLSNLTMAPFTDNASGTFYGFTYRSDVGFLRDPAPGVDQ